MNLDMILSVYEVGEVSGCPNLVQLLRSTAPDILYLSALNVSSLKRRTNDPISAVETTHTNYRVLRRTQNKRRGLHWDGLDESLPAHEWQGGVMHIT
jgi:hypothetical protein